MHNEFGIRRCIGYDEAGEDGLFPKIGTGWLKKNDVPYCPVYGDIVVDMGDKNGRRMAIIGSKVQRIINVAMSTNYLKIPQENLVNLKFLDENNTNEEDSLILSVISLTTSTLLVLVLYTPLFNWSVI